MTYRKYKSQVKKIVKETIERLEFPDLDFDVQETQKAEFGDFYVNVPFLLAKKLRRNPMEIAGQISDAIENIPNLTVEPCKPGYLNFRIDYAHLVYETIRNGIESDFHFPDLGRGEKVLVEHTSVNPNKALHIGHARNLCVGDSIARLLRSAGYNVSILNYIDDSGLQVSDIVVGFLYAGFALNPKDEVKFDHYAGDTVYVKVNELYENDPALLEKRKSVLKELEGDGEISKFAKEVTDRILREQLKTAWRLGARYDLLTFESQIISSHLWEDLFETMKNSGITRYESAGKLAGTWIVTMMGDESNEKDEKVLVRSDGTATYIAKDIPFAAWKLGLVDDRFYYRIFADQPDGIKLWSTTLEKGESEHPQFCGAKKAITVIDVRQNRLQEILKSVLGEISKTSIEDRYMHLGYEVVTLSKETALELGISGTQGSVQMSGRKGIYINVDVALDSIRTRAIEETKQRNPDDNDDWIESVAEKISVAALRYALLKQDLEKIVVFDLREALRLEGETGPYVLYSHARASRILEKSGGEEPSISHESAKLLDKEWESSLIKSIAKLTLRIEEAHDNLAPKTIAKYAYLISSEFNSFYEKSPVIREENQDLRKARLALVYTFRNTIRTVTKILGLETPDRI